MVRKIWGNNSAFSEICPAGPDRYRLSCRDRGNENVEVRPLFDRWNRGLGFHPDLHWILFRSELSFYNQFSVQRFHVCRDCCSGGNHPSAGISIEEKTHEEGRRKENSKALNFQI